MAEQQVKAFNIIYNQLVPVLITSVSIHEAFDPQITKPPDNLKDFRAIWDTGATRTAISKKVVEGCGLVPTGMCRVKTAGGEKDSFTYLVSVFLPNKVCFSQLRVTQADITDADVLIGMDIIASGDFAVTNLNGKTNLSFRIPSVECIDFVKKPPNVVSVGDKELRKVGRNEPSPCGSGKKYKKCHGA